MADVLSHDALRTALDELEGWAGTIEDGIRKTYRFEDFMGSIGFVNRVAAIAEELNHHPDVSISWNRVELRIISHAAGGVTPACLDLARRIDAEAVG